MATFREMMQNDASLFLNADEFGEEIFFTPAAGVVKTIVAVRDNAEFQDIDASPEFAATRRTILISAVDDTAGHINVKIRGVRGNQGGDTVTFPGDPAPDTVWYVVKRVDHSLVMHRLTLTTNPADVY